MGVYRRGNRWYVRYREGGRLIRKSLGPDITSEAQARAVWRKLERARLEGRLGLLDPSRVTLEAFRREYVRVRRGLIAPGGRKDGGLSAATVRRDEQALRSLESVLGGDTRLRNIRQRQIDQWASALMSRAQRPVKPATVASYLRHIKAALHTAVEWGQLRAVPKLKSIKVSQDPAGRSLLPNEAKRLLALETNPERRALWEFFLWTGLRRQEVINLQWQDVHLEGDAPWMEVVGKGGKRRVVPLLPGALRALEAMPRYDLGPVWRFHVRRYREPRPVTGSPMSRWFKQAARRAGLEHARLHDLRHTSFTWLAAAGVPERIIQEIAGHASITTTQLYTRGMARVADLHQHVARADAWYRKSSTPQK
jgi:integrase